MGSVSCCSYSAALVFEAHAVGTLRPVPLELAHALSFLAKDFITLSPQYLRFPDIYDVWIALFHTFKRKSPYTEE